MPAGAAAYVILQLLQHEALHVAARGVLRPEMMVRIDDGHVRRQHGLDLGTRQPRVVGLLRCAVGPGRLHGCQRLRVFAGAGIAIASFPVLGLRSTSSEKQSPRQGDGDEAEQNWEQRLQLQIGGRQRVELLR